MMTSSNGNIFLVTFFVTGEIPLTKAIDAGFDVFSDQRLNKRLSQQPSRQFVRRRGAHYDVTVKIILFGMVSDVLKYTHF